METEEVLCRCSGEPKNKKLRWNARRDLRVANGVGSVVCVAVGEYLRLDEMGFLVAGARSDLLPGSHLWRGVSLGRREARKRCSSPIRKLCGILKV